MEELLVDDSNYLNFGVLSEFDPSQSGALQQKVESLVERYPPFEWQEGDKFLTLARIYADEGTILVEDTSSQKDTTRNSSC